MKTIFAVMLGVAGLYAVTLVPSPVKEVSGFQTMSYKGINYEALEELKGEIGKQKNLQDLDKINHLMGNLSEEKTVEYESHDRKPKHTPWMVGVYLAGLLVGVAGVVVAKSKGNRNEQSDADFSHKTMKRILRDLNYPVLICDKEFNLIWQNTESSILALNPQNIQKLFSDSNALRNFEFESRNYSIQMETVENKTGTTNYVIQLIPKVIAPEFLSHLVSTQEVERVLEASFKESDDFKGLNQLVAENVIKMNSLFKASSKVLDVDFDENLSECFIEADHLDAAIKEFITAGYELVRDQKTAEGLYLRTSEKGQRFNLSCFIPEISKEQFSSTNASDLFIQRLTSLETKFNLYYPRISFRWINSGEVKGVDVCLSLENKSELESLLKESNA